MRTGVELTRLAGAKLASPICTQEPAESVQDVTRGLQLLRRQLVQAPHAVKLILQASNHIDGRLMAKLQYDAFGDLLSSTVNVRVRPAFHTLPADFLGYRDSAVTTCLGSCLQTLSICVEGGIKHALPLWPLVQIETSFPARLPPQTWSQILQELQAEVDATNQLLGRCRSSFETLVQHYGEHPASMHDLEFWHDIQAFVAALSAAQQRQEALAQV